MEAHVMDWLHLLLRWFHFTVGVAWIGASFYFVWLENHLNRIGRREGIAGDLWAIHGGGFYFIEKYKVSPGEIPKKLHWFKYEAYFTWISGFSLLVLLYYLNAKLYLVSQDSGLTDMQSIMLGLGVLFGGWIIYDLMCKSPLGKRGPLLAAIGYVGIVALTYGLCQWMNPRGAYMHIGALLGTCMAANVFFVIIPSQKALVAAAKRGESPDPEFGVKAGLRSRHNNYLTLPVLFVMIANHFPMTFGHEDNWFVLAMIILLGAGVRHWFNLNGMGKTNRWILPGCLLLLVFIITYSAPQTSTAQVEKVSFSEVQPIIKQRCNTCHAAKPTDDTFIVAPAGVMFDTPEQIKTWADRIRMRTSVLKSMPFGNKTDITDEERDLISRWVESGASIED